LLAAWGGEWGGEDAVSAYRGFVEAGLSDSPGSPFRETFGGWVLGSSTFVDRLRALAGSAASDPPAREARHLAGRDAGAVVAAVAEHYALDPGALRRCHDRHIARAMAAWLCRCHTVAPLSEIAGRLGLSRADSVPGLSRRLESRLKDAPELIREVGRIERLLPAGTSAGATAGETPVSPPGRSTRKSGKNPVSQVRPSG
jgi:hypothetical protein